MSGGTTGELIFAVSVSSFTKRGYVGSSSFEGRPVDLEFDDADAGVFLTAAMLKKLGAKDGSKLVLVVDADGEPEVTETIVPKVGSKPRISSAKVYYEIGREGGAVLKIRKA